MVTKTVRGDVFKSSHHQIAFAVNAEGTNDAGFAGAVARLCWPEIATIGPCKLGQVISKTFDDRTFHACVVHDSSEIGWSKAPELVEHCLNSIATNDNEEIGVVMMGAGMIGTLSGANPKAILEGMNRSTKKVVVFSL